MAIEIYRSRRNRFFECKFWVRDQEDPANENLSYLGQPTGKFFATESSSKDEEADEFGGMRAYYSTVTLETVDDISAMGKDDLVEYNGSIWKVIDISSSFDVKQSQFLQGKAPRRSYVRIRK